jgi:hypothetical protein
VSRSMFRKSAQCTSLETAIFSAGLDTEITEADCDEILHNCLRLQVFGVCILFNPGTLISRSLASLLFLTRLCGVPPCVLNSLYTPFLRIRYVLHNLDLSFFPPYPFIVRSRPPLHTLSLCRGSGFDIRSCLRLLPHLRDLRLTETRLRRLSSRHRQQSRTGPPKPFAPSSITYTMLGAVFQKLHSSPDSSA